MEGLESCSGSSSLVGETVEATVDRSAQGMARAKRIRNSYVLLSKGSGDVPIALRRK